MWIRCENDVKVGNLIIFTFFPYYFHIVITFLGSGPRSGPQKSYFCHIPGHILFILFSYFCICLGWAPCPYRNLCNMWECEPQPASHLDAGLQDPSMQSSISARSEPAMIWEAVPAQEQTPGLFSYMGLLRNRPNRAKYRTEPNRLIWICMDLCWSICIWMDFAWILYNFVWFYMFFIKNQVR